MQLTLKRSPTAHKTQTRPQASPRAFAGRIFQGGPTLPPVAQAKLRVNAPNDKYEQEAEQVANWVTRLPEPPGVPDVEEELAQPQSLQPSVGGTMPVQTRPLVITSLAPVKRQVSAESIEDEEVQAKAEPAARLGKQEALVRGLQGHGQPLPLPTRRFFESRMGYDFSGVRIHPGTEGAAASRALNACAFTLRGDISFAPGEYAPDSADGRHLLAHELTHVVQQGAAKPRIQRQPAQRIARHGGAPRVQRQEADPTEFRQAGWREINDLGIVYQESGARLREAPEGGFITLLPQNTKVFILKHQPVGQWYAVTTVEPGGSRFGYIADWLIWRRLPDPDADVLKIKPGQSPLVIAAVHYARRGFNVWGKDLRYVVNALVWVNQNARHNAPGESGIRKPDSVSQPWFTAQSTAGVYIWLPGPDHMNALYDTVAKHGGGTGSLTADLWRTVKSIAHGLAYGAAFVGGLVHGFVKSLYDTVVALGKMVIDVLVSIFSGNVIRDAKALWESISQLTWDDIKGALAAGWEKWEHKLTSSSPWVSGHAHGYLTGYIMAEAVLLLVSGGTVAALKGAVWASRLGQAIKASRAFRTMRSGIESARRAGGAVGRAMSETGTAVRRSQAFRTLAVAQRWAVERLLLPAHIIRDLTLEAINRLRQLPEDILDKLSRLSAGLKRRALGCASSCRVDLGEVTAYVNRVTGRQAERLAISESTAYWRVHQTLISFARHNQTFNSIARTLKNRMEQLGRAGQRHLLPHVDDAVLHMPVDEFIRRNPRLRSEWRAMSREARNNPGLAREMTDFLEGGTRAGARNVGSRKPDIVEFFLQSGEVVVTDVTLRVGERVHTFKTVFYKEVMQTMLGPRGPRVYGLDIDPTSALRMRSRVID